jgi:hypothetical protein
MKESDSLWAASLKSEYLSRLSDQACRPQGITRRNATIFYIEPIPQRSGYIAGQVETL